MAKTVKSKVYIQEINGTPEWAEKKRGPSEENLAIARQLRNKLTNLPEGRGVLFSPKFKMYIFNLVREEEDLKDMLFRCTAKNPKDPNSEVFILRKHGIRYVKGKK